MSTTDKQYALLGAAVAGILDAHAEVGGEPQAVLSLIKMAAEVYGVGPEDEE